LFIFDALGNHNLYETSHIETHHLHASYFENTAKAAPAMQQAMP
jgi:hypothetical protein